MVTVAKKLDGPIKLLLMRWGDAEKPFSMLGLGDILVPGLSSLCLTRSFAYMLIPPFLFFLACLPGIYIALMLRYDVFRALRKHFAANPSAASSLSLPHPLPLRFSTLPYFTFSLLSYVIGLVCTVAVMTIFQHAQVIFFFHFCCS